eukprot:4738517-Pyramimonas_sp.AAC.1
MNSTNSRIDTSVATLCLPNQVKNPPVGDPAPCLLNELFSEVTKSASEKPSGVLRNGIRSTAVNQMICAIHVTGSYPCSSSKASVRVLVLFPLQFWGGGLDPL